MILLLILIMSLSNLVQAQVIAVQPSLEDVNSAYDAVSNPYIISTMGHLSWLTQNPSAWDKAYKQSGTIDASITQFWDDIDDNSDNDKYNDPNDATDTGLNEGFAPLGNGSTLFTGFYYGQNDTILDVTINRASSNFVGFFGYLSGATIEDVVLMNINVTGHNYVGGLVGRNYASSTIDHSHCYGVILGNDYIGGLVGYNSSSTINSSLSSGYVNGSGRYIGGLAGDNSYSSVISYSHASGSVLGSGDYVGGLVGLNYSGSTIQNSYSNNTVTGNSNYVGGIVGLNDNNGTLTACSSSGILVGGDYIGGLVGNSEGGGDLSNCSSSRNVTGMNFVGGLIGYSSASTTSKSFNSGNVVAGGNNIGGLVGYNSYSTVNNSYSTGSVTGNDYVGGFIGRHYTSSNINYCYSTGAVSGQSSRVGGLVGGSNFSTTTTRYSFWDVETSGKMTSDGGTGKTTAEMKDYLTFLAAGWDFVSETANGTNNYWDADQLATVNDGYMILSWQSGADNTLPIDQTFVSKEFALGHTYPNPFNAAFTLPFTLNETMLVTASIYDITGRQVQLIFDQEMSPGEYSHIVNTANLSSGLYFLSIRMGNNVQTREIALIK